MKNNRFNLFIVGFVFLLLVLACGESNNQTQTAPNSTPETPAAPTSAPTSSDGNQSIQTVSDIKWSDYDKIYNLKSNSTDMQKEALWKNFEGKVVMWTGTVADVSEGTLGGLKLNIKMNPHTITHDISISVKENQKDKLAALTKGKKVAFTGKLKSYGGAVLPLMMEDGELK